MDFELADSACQFREIGQNSNQILSISYNYILIICYVRLTFGESADLMYQKKGDKTRTFSRLSGVKIIGVFTMMTSVVEYHFSFTVYKISYVKNHTPFLENMG